MQWTRERHNNKIVHRSWTPVLQVFFPPLAIQYIGVHRYNRSLIGHDYDMKCLKVDTAMSFAFSTDHWRWDSG